MKTVKKPTKAHKSKKVVKAHQGFAADGSKATAEQSKPKSQSVSVAPQGQVGSLRRRAPPPSQPRATLVKEPVRALPKPMDEKDGRGQPLQIRRNLNYSLPPGYMKEMDTQREINKRMRGNKVVADNQANIQRRKSAEIKRRGGREKLFQNQLMEEIDYYMGGTKGKRPEQVDPFKGMSSRERRRAQNAQKSEFDETNRQVRKQMGTQRKPRRPKPIGQPNTTVIPGFLAEPQLVSPSPIQPVRQPPRGSSCPSPDTFINLSGNKTKQAGKLAVGDMVYTQHENTLEWGDYAVSHVSIIPNSKRLKLVFDTTEIVCSLSHKMYVDNKGWTKAEDMESDDVVSGHTLKDVLEWEAGDVVKITVEDAHSYIAAGLLSHNKSIATISPQNQPTVPRNKTKPFSLGPLPNNFTMNKGGAVKKKYTEVKTLKQGGYVSRAKYGSVDNLKKKK